MSNIIERKIHIDLDYDLYNFMENEIARRDYKIKALTHELECYKKYKNSLFSVLSPPDFVDIDRMTPNLKLSVVLSSEIKDCKLHVIARCFESGNRKYKQYGYYVDSSIYDELSEKQIKMVMLNMHKKLVSDINKEIMGEI